MDRNQSTTKGNQSISDLAMAKSSSSLPNKAVICIGCRKEFANRAALFEHLKDQPGHMAKPKQPRSSDAPKPNKCATCGKDFSDRVLLYKHLKDLPDHMQRLLGASKVKDESLYCKRCDKNFVDMNGLRNHLDHSAVHGDERKKAKHPNSKPNIIPMERRHEIALAEERGRYHKFLKSHNFDLSKKTRDQPTEVSVDGVTEKDTRPEHTEKFVPLVLKTTEEKPHPAPPKTDKNTLHKESDLGPIKQDHHLVEIDLMDMHSVISTPALKPSTSPASADAIKTVEPTTIQETPSPVRVVGSDQSPMSTSVIKPGDSTSAIIINSNGSTQLCWGKCDAHLTSTTALVKHLELGTCMGKRTITAAALYRAAANSEVCHDVIDGRYLRDLTIGRDVVARYKGNAFPFVCPAKDCGLVFAKLHGLFKHVEKCDMVTDGPTKTMAELTEALMDDCCDK